MSNYVLECRGITKSYHDGDRELNILQGIDLALSKGEILAISGASGVGKSTLLHIMGTLDKPSSGELLMDGKPVIKMGRRAINRLRNVDLGFVFQFYHLLPEFTALENVMMPALAKGGNRRKCMKRALELLDKVGLTDRATHKPGKLSGGEQQRVAIARALYNRPTVILADEPTGNLDESTGVEIVDLLFRLNRDDGVTLAFVTHDEGLAQRADRWIHLHEGLAVTRKG